MKTLKINLPKVAASLIFTLFLFTTTSLTSTNLQVSNEEVEQYIYNNGYALVNSITWDGNDATVDTENSYHTIVYTDGTLIVGHEDWL